jgi:hypothetical protein
LGSVSVERKEGRRRRDWGDSKQWGDGGWGAGGGYENRWMECARGKQRMIMKERAGWM